MTYRADGRSVLTNAADPDLLVRVAEDWAPPSEMPAAVDRLWERACGQFISGAVAYENFTDAVRTGFEAVDAALRLQNADLLKEREKLTLGPLIERANRNGRLSSRQYAWLSAYALRFRNRLTHSDGADPIVVSPGMAAEMMAGIGHFLADFLTGAAEPVR